MDELAKHRSPCGRLARPPSRASVPRRRRFSLSCRPRLCRTRYCSASDSAALVRGISHSSHGWARTQACFGQKSCNSGRAGPTCGNTTTGLVGTLSVWPNTPVPDLPAAWGPLGSVSGPDLMRPRKAPIRASCPEFRSEGRSEARPEMGARGSRKPVLRLRSLSLAPISPNSEPRRPFRGDTLSGGPGAWAKSAPEVARSCWIGPVTHGANTDVCAKQGGHIFGLTALRTGHSQPSSDGHLGEREPPCLSAQTRHVACARRSSSRRAAQLLIVSDRGVRSGSWPDESERRGGVKRRSSSGRSALVDAPSVAPWRLALRGPGCTTSDHARNPHSAPEWRLLSWFLKRIDRN